MSVAETAADIAEALDEVRRELWGDGAKLVLLRVSGRTAPYDVIGEITTGWDPGTQSGMELRIRIADISETTASLISRTTHVMLVDTDLPALNHVIWGTKKGTTPPFGTRPFWVLRVATEGRRYDPPQGAES